MSTSLSSVDLSGSYYARHSSLQKGLTGELLKGYEFSSILKVLDIGCGSGDNTAEIAEKVFNGSIVGIDSSPSMIDYAKTTYPLTEFPNLTFKIQRAEDISFAERFDLIVTFSCWHWVRDPARALERACNHLEPGGEFFILTYSHSDYYKCLQEVLRESYPDYYDESAYHTMMPIEDYRSTLQKCGMNIEEFDVRNLILPHKNEEDMKEFVRGWLVSFIALPESLQEQFLDAVARKSYDFAIDLDDGGINMPYTALIIKARKPSI